MPLTKKEKRAYQRLVTGLSIGNHQSAFMRFMTLTSSPDSPDINKSFDVLKKRIFRATPEKDGFHGFKFNRYFKLKTAEGNNVLHIIYWGRFIPVEWLKATWDQIHGAFKVDIRACWENKGRKMNRVNGLVGYLLTNYLTKQPILRMSYGWKWAWLGFCKSWKHVKKVGLIHRAGKLSDKPPWLVYGSNRGHMYFSGLKRYLNAQLHTFSTSEAMRVVSPFDMLYRPWCDEKSELEKKNWAAVLSLHHYFRNVSLEYWNSLVKNPLSSTRQLRFCSPDRVKWLKGVYWVWPWFRWPVVKASKLLPKVRTTQSVFDLDRENRKILLKCRSPKGSGWNDVHTANSVSDDVDVSELENEFGYSEAHRFAMV